MTHCWTDRGEWIEETYGYLSDEYLDDAVRGYNGADDEICVLPDGHFGPHKWTPVGEIVVRFAEAELVPENDTK